jgi:hypothetical protein
MIKKSRTEKNDYWCVGLQGKLLINEKAPRYQGAL